MFRIVQPYGKDKARESTTISEHASAAEAFAELDRIAAQMRKTGVPRNVVIELIVIDADGQIVPRPHAH